MKKTEIRWSFNSTTSSSVFFEPQKIKIHNPKSVNKGFIRCPAGQNYRKNTFVVRSPYTFTIRHHDNKYYSPIYPATEVADDIIKNIIFFEPKVNWLDNNKPILQLVLPYVFFSDETVYINQIEPSTETLNKNWSLIQGRFNIYNWQRPLNWAIQWFDLKSDLVIKRGDPLFHIHFETTNPDNDINLSYQKMTSDLQECLNSSHNITKLMRGTSKLLNRNTRKIKRLIK